MLCLCVVLFRLFLSLPQAYDERCQAWALVLSGDSYNGQVKDPFTFFLKCLRPAYKPLTVVKIPTPPGPQHPRRKMFPGGARHIKMQLMHVFGPPIPRYGGGYGGVWGEGLGGYGVGLGGYGVGMGGMG